MNCSRGYPLDPELWSSLLFLSTWQHISWFVLSGVCLCKTLHAEPKVYLLEKRWNAFFPIQTLFTVMVYGGMITVDACCYPAIFFKACFSHCASKRSHLEALHEERSGWTSLWVVPELWGSAMGHMGPSSESWANVWSHQPLGLFPLGWTSLWPWPGGWSGQEWRCMLISTVQSCHQEARSHMVPTWFGVGTPNLNQLAFVWKCPGRVLVLSG